MAGSVIAFYQLGYGIAAFGIGRLLDDGVQLSTIYAVSAVIAAGMGILSFAVARARSLSPGMEGRAEGTSPARRNRDARWETPPRR
jgi:hypothetical protein